MENKLLTIWNELQSVLCDPDGNACIHGSGEDLNIIDSNLRRLYDLVVKNDQ